MPGPVSGRKVFTTGRKFVHLYMWLGDHRLREAFVKSARSPHRWLPAALAACLWLAPSFPVSAFTALVGFGDSYTDTGNAPSSPPDYWNGRFSNGPLWIEDLSVMLGFSYNPANNYAVSGTEADQLGVAIANFPGTADSANVLFAIWSGNNDFANHLNIGGNDAAWDTEINWIVSSLTTASDLLYQKGARNIILFNQMDLTRCPDIMGGYSATFRAYISGKVQIFNSRLAAAIPGLLSSHPGLQVYLVDAYSDFNYLLDNYASLGFATATVGALNDPNLSDKSFSGPGANYVWWDDQHPTAKAHALVAGWVYGVLPPPPPPPPPGIAITAPQSGAQFTAPASLPVSVTVFPNGWSIGQVNLYANGALLGQLNNPPYTFTLSALPAGTYGLDAQAAFGSGQSVNSPTVQVTVLPPPGSPAPPPWNDQDIGAVGLPGSAYLATDGTFTVTGSGADIWDVADAFHYLYQPFSGDGSIVALVSSQQNTDGFAKAGLMFRQTLDPGSPNVLTSLTPSFGVDFQDRPAMAVACAYVPGPLFAAPYWLKLERLGNTFNAYASQDATTWSLITSAVVPMPAVIYAGLAVTSHNNSLLNTATFAGVQFVHPTPPAPPLLSIARSATGQIQLTLSGSLGATYATDISTNLTTWMPLSTNLNTSGTILILPTQAPPGAWGFFRARLVQ